MFPTASSEPELIEVLSASGRPLFVDAEATQLERTHGVAAAWRAVIARHAEQAPCRVGGDFSVAWRAGGRTFLAVDRFAVRSMCWRVDGNQLRHAERADALSTRGADQLSAQALYDYLYFHVVPSPQTIFKDVQRLPPGHLGIFEAGAMRVLPYWQPRFEPEYAADFPTWRDRFRQCLDKAVRAQLDGSKAACFLSGGTDSSTVAGLIAAAVGGPNTTGYSIGFEAEGYDEMAYARLAAQHFGCKHYAYYVKPGDLLHGMPKVARHYDQPFGNSSAVPAYFCALHAQEDGVSRLLAGDGGDELFGGNSRYAKQAVFGWYGRVPRALRERAIEPLLSRSALGQLPLLRKGASYVEQARLPMPDRMQSYNLLERIGLKTIFEADFLAQVDPSAPQRHQQTVWQAATAESDIDRMLAYDWRYTLAETDLPKVCGTTNLAGVSVGFPMLDPGMLELSLHMRADWKLRRLKLRWFFKEALRGFLPDAIIRKPKHGFGLPFGVWALQHDALRRLVADALGSLATRGIVRPQFLRTLLDDLLPSHAGFYGELVWILVMLELWLRDD